MAFFIDPYKNYYEKLNGASSIVSESETITSKIGDASTPLSNLKSSLSSSSWQELGISELATTTIPSLITNMTTLQSNFESSLKQAVAKAINELLPETEKLKTEDENYDAIKKELDELTPVDEKNSSEYSSYITKKTELTKKLNESKTKCDEYKKNCDNIVTAIKALDSAVADFPKASESTSSNADDTTIEVIDGEANGTMYKINFHGTEFYVAKTKTNLFEYEQYLLQNGITQNAGFKDGQCNVLSQQIAVDLMRGTMTRKSIYASSEASPATRINNQVRSQNEEDILKYVYQEVSNGRPVALQVTQRRSNEGLRHFVTVVGFDASVKSYKDLTPDKILVLDCVDGKVQTLSGKERTDGKGHNRKLFNQGGKGYYALGATQTFLAKEVYKTNTANA